MRDGFDREVLRLVRRLARSGLLEYSLVRAGRSGESSSSRQVPDYWPRLPELGDDDTLVLSRFAYIRRRASEMVLELPQSGALFRLGDPAAAAMLATLSAHAAGCLAPLPGWIPGYRTPGSSAR